jgi:chromate transporter
LLKFEFICKNPIISSQVCHNHNFERHLGSLQHISQIGLTAFGGPATYIGMFHQEVVQRCQWATDKQFLYLLGATNLISDPNSTEIAIHRGLALARWSRFIAGGLAFTLPVVLIFLALAWPFVTYSSTPQARARLYTIKPVMIAVIVQTLRQLGRKAIVVKNHPQDWLSALFGLGVIDLYFLGVHELLLLPGGLVVMPLVFLITFNSTSSSRISTIPTESSPLAGPSRMSSPGSWIRALANPSRCALPWERVPARRSA